MEYRRRKTSGGGRGLFFFILRLTIRIFGFLNDRRFPRSKARRDTQTIFHVCPFLAIFVFRLRNRLLNRVRFTKSFWFFLCRIFQLIVQNFRAVCCPDRIGRLISSKTIPGGRRVVRVSGSFESQTRFSPKDIFVLFRARALITGTTYCVPRTGRI